MKVAYISPIFFSDIDISLLHELQKKADVYYFILLGPLFRSAAVDIREPIRESGVFPASVYPELSRFREYINLNKVFVVNRTATHVSSPINILTYLKLASILRKGHFDIIHISDFLTYTELPLLLFRKRMVLSVHDPIPHSSLQSGRVSLQRRFLLGRLKHFIIFNSRQKQEFVKEYGLEDKSIAVTHFGPFDYLKGIEQKPFDIGGPYILFFGQILSNKGLEYLFPAMKIVHEHHPEVKLMVVGRGRYYFDISEYRNLPYFIIENRFIPDSELAHMIEGSLFVICPYNDATQSGVVMSAFAFNKPVIATNTGGLPEMVRDGEFGYIVPTRDENALAGRIEYLLEHPDERAEMEKSIAEYYESGEGSWKSAVNDITNIYEMISTEKNDR